MFLGQCGHSSRQNAAEMLKEVGRYTELSKQTNLTVLHVFSVFLDFFTIIEAVDDKL